jgi:hypothetical protein
MIFNRMSLMFILALLGGTPANVIVIAQENNIANMSDPPSSLLSLIPSDVPSLAPILSDLPSIAPIEISTKVQSLTRTVITTTEELVSSGKRRLLRGSVSQEEVNDNDTSSARFLMLSDLPSLSPSISMNSDVPSSVPVLSDIPSRPLIPSTSTGVVKSDNTMVSLSIQLATDDNSITEDKKYVPLKEFFVQLQNQQL